MIRILQPKLLLALALAATCGWMTERQVAGPAAGSSRDVSFMGGLESSTDSLLHLLEGREVGKREGNTAGAEVSKRSLRRCPSREALEMP